MRLISLGLAILSGDKALLRFPQVLGDSFSLYPDAHYRLRKPIGGWSAGTVIRFIGTHTEPADRTWDTYWDFESDDGTHVSLGPGEVPQSVAGSYDMFADTTDTSQANWINPSTMGALRHRAVRIRELAAAQIDTQTPGLEQIMPELVHLALGRGATANPFLPALQRLGVPARQAAESIADAMPGAKHQQTERLLAQLGSQRYFDAYVTQLSDPDPQRVRFAIARLVDIGNPDSLDAMRPLLTHPHLNVQFDARSAIAKLEKEN